VKTLYILSDSTAVGQFVTIHKTWPVLLSQHLEGRYIVQNVSRNGETSRQALERLVPDVLRYEPDLVYIQYGSNDANEWETDRGYPRLFEDEYNCNIQSMIARCHRFGAEVIVGGSHTSWAYNNLFENNLFGFIHAFVDHSQYKGDYVMDDGIHLNEYGHQLYFENIKNVIP